MTADEIEREAASIVAAIETRKAAPYQASDKALVAEYLRAVAPAGPRSHEITADALNLSYPLWAIIRDAYFNKACDWKREQRNESR